MRGILSTLVIFFAILFTSASAHAGGFLDNRGSAAEDYWEDQNRLQNKLAKARADADFKCSRSTYEACMAAQAKVDRLEWEANGFGGNYGNRHFRSHRKNRDLSAREYWERFEQGLRLADKVVRSRQNNTDELLGEIPARVPGRKYVDDLPVCTNQMIRKSIPCYQPY